MSEPQVDKHPARIAGMFDAIARRYDFLNHFLSAGLDRSWRRRAVRSLDIRGTETLLDLCTGTADIALAASGVRRVIGVDFAFEMLKIGRRKVADAHRPRIFLVRGDAMNLPCADATIDLTTIAFGIRNVEDPGAALREVARVMKPGGRLAILEFAAPRMPILQSLYRAYFRVILPRLGSLISGHDTAYAYLPASVLSFPPPHEFCTRLRAAGFSDVHADPLTLGIVYLYRATK